MTFARLLLSAAALIGYAAAAQAQGAFPAPLPGQAAAPAGAPPPMTATSPSMSPAFPAPGAGGGFAPPGAMGPGGFSQQPGPPGAGQQCNTEFLALKTDAQKKAEAISAITKRKGTAAEACKAFSGFVQAEAKMISYLEKNTVRCGIPTSAATQMKKNHAGTVGIQSKVCAAAQAQAQGQQQAAPSLSEALGSASLPEARETKKGGSTFDTLNGNVLTR